jgi:hypothetical protein
MVNQRERKCSRNREFWTALVARPGPGPPPGPARPGPSHEALQKASPDEALICNQASPPVLLRLQRLHLSDLARIAVCGSRSASPPALQRGKACPIWCRGAKIRPGSRSPWNVVVREVCEARCGLPMRHASMRRSAFLERLARIDSECGGVV